MKGELKILPDFFSLVISGQKKCEVRLNDRLFKVGELYLLREFTNNHYTGRSCLVCITHVLDSFVGLAEGYCVFSFSIVQLFL